MKFSFTSALFVGGKSIRMGVDKATIKRKGVSLWQTQLEKLKTSNPDAIFIVAPEMPEWMPQGGEIWCKDTVPNTGPLGGLVAALQIMKTSHLQVLAVDLLQMTAPYLEFIRSHVSSECGVVPFVDGGGEPLCAVYPREAFYLAQSHLEQRMLSLQSLIAKLKEYQCMETLQVSSADASLFLNCNRVEDLPPDVY